MQALASKISLIQVLALRGSRTSGVPYSAATTVLCAELLKAMISFAMAASKDELRQLHSFRDMLRVCGA